jgi:hypothetical protein
MLLVGVVGAGELFPNAAGGRGAGDALRIDAIEELRGGGVAVTGGAARVGLGVYVESKKKEKT